jgi:hypothetical protein
LGVYGSWWPWAKVLQVPSPLSVRSSNDSGILVEVDVPNSSSLGWGGGCCTVGHAGQKIWILMADGLIYMYSYIHTSPIGSIYVGCTHT